MQASPDTPHRHRHQGTEYLFCSAGCREKFVRDPQKYISKTAADDHHAAGDGHTGHAAHQPAATSAHVAKPPARPAATKIEWTCPMHPQIVRDAPGHCPICGMALEPRTVSLEEPVNPELVDMTRRFWVSVVLSIPLVALAMGQMLVGHPLLGSRTPWVELVLASPVVMWGGFPFFVRAWQSVVHRSLNMFTLIGLGVSVAYVYSLVATLLPGVFPAALRNVHGQVPAYFEPAAVIVALVLLGQVMELRARSRTGAAIRALLGLAPKTARRVREDGNEKDV